MSIDNHKLTEKERSMFATWDFPVSNFRAKMARDLPDLNIPEDYDDAVLKMASGTRKGQNYFAFLSKNCVLKVIFTR